MFIWTKLILKDEIIYIIFSLRTYKWKGFRNIDIQKVKKF